MEKDPILLEKLKEMQVNNLRDLLPNSWELIRSEADPDATFFAKRLLRGDFPFDVIDSMIVHYAKGKKK
jgi:hypothetical protein